MLESEKPLSSEQEKPKVLYHASSNKIIEKFDPRAESYRDPDEGPVVFAIPDQAYASMFIVPVDDKWSRISIFNDVHAIIISDKERFQKLDKGGAIYSLSSDTFNSDPQKNEPEHEWTSKESVKPSNKTIYENGLEEMIENGSRFTLLIKQHLIK